MTKELGLKGAQLHTFAFIYSTYNKDKKSVTLPYDKIGRYIGFTLGQVGSAVAYLKKERLIDGSKGEKGVSGSYWIVGEMNRIFMGWDK